MADLGLAIAGVLATGAAVAQGLYELYRSVANASKDAQDIATHIEFVNAALRVLQQTLQKSNGIESEILRKDLRLVLYKCQDLFNSVSKVTDPIIPRLGENPGAVARFGGRVQWFFKKNEVKLIIGRLDSIQTSINMMVSTVTLGLLLRNGDPGQLSPDLNDGLLNAREMIKTGKSTLATLASIEEEYFEETSEKDEPDDEEVEEDGKEKDSSIHAWLSHLIGFNDQDSVEDRSQYGISVRSAITLSEIQRSITGATTDDVELLLEKWTTLSDRKSTATRDKTDMETTIPDSEVNGYKGDSVTSVVSGIQVSDEEYDDTSGEAATSESSEGSPSELEGEEDTEGASTAKAKTSSQSISEARHDSNVKYVDATDAEDSSESEHRLSHGSSSGSESVVVQRSFSRTPAKKQYKKTPLASPCLPKLSKSRKSDGPSGRTTGLTSSSQKPKQDTIVADTPISCDPATTKTKTRRPTLAVQDENSDSFAAPRPADQTLEDNDPNSPEEIIPTWRKVPFPKKLQIKDDDDDGTVRELKRIERKKKMDAIPEHRESNRRPLEEDEDEEQVEDQEDEQADNLAQGETYPTPWVEEWLAGGSGARSNTQRRPVPASPFSEISIFEPTRSQAPSVISSLAPESDAATGDRVRKLVKMANRLMRMESIPEAASLYRQAYNLKKQGGVLEHDPELLDIEFRIAVVFGKEKKWKSAERILERVLTRQRAAFGYQKSTTQLTAHYLARLYSRQLRWADAYLLYTSLWDRRRDCLHKVTAKSTDLELALRTGNEYGRVLLAMDQFVEAIDVLQVIYPICQNVRGQEDAQITLDTALRLGSALVLAGKITEAETVYDQVSQLLSAHPQPPQEILSDCKLGMAKLALHAEDYTAAEMLATEAWDIRKATTNATDAVELDIRQCLATALQRLEKWDEAHKTLNLALRDGQRVFGQSHPFVLRVGSSLGKILLSLGRPIEAERILQTAFTACSASDKEVTPEKLVIAEQLGPLIISNTQLISDELAISKRKQQALIVYHYLYDGQKKTLGSRSMVTLDAGHEYGGLCNELFDYKNAERALSHVYMERARLLGENNPQVIATRYQLGEVYFWTHKPQEAQALLGGVHDYFTNTVGLQNAPAIQCMEILALALMSGNPDDTKRDEAYSLLQCAFDARKVHSGLTRETFASALRVSVIAVAQKRVPEAQSALTWVFDNTQGADVRYQFAKIMTGVASSALWHIGQNRRAGNQRMEQVVDYVREVYGRRGKAMRLFCNGQALVLFLQRESRQCRVVLQNYWNMQKQLLGPHHRKTLASGEVFSIGMILDSILSKRHITSEAAKVNDWLYRQNGNRPTATMQFCMIAAISAALFNWDEISRSLILWLYETQKRLFGRLSRQTLTTLAVSYALRIKKRFRKQPSSDGTRKDPRVFVPMIWKTFTNMMNEIPLSMQESTFFTQHLPIILARAAIVKKVTEKVLVNELSRIFIGPIGKLFEEDDGGLPHQSQSLRDMLFRSGVYAANNSSRVWTLSSNASDNGDETGRGHPLRNLDQNTSLFDLLDVDEKNAERLSSIGGSLVDLVIGSQDDDEPFQRLQDELVNEIVTEEDIESVRNNLDQFERDVADSS